MLKNVMFVWLGAQLPLGLIIARACGLNDRLHARVSRAR